MSELDLFNAYICSKTFAKHAESFVRHLIMTHVEELEVPCAKQILLDWGHLLIV